MEADHYRENFVGIAEQKIGEYTHLLLLTLSKLARFPIEHKNQQISIFSVLWNHSGESG